MTVFADSSALVTTFVREKRTARLPDVVVVSALARVEVTAAFWRKVRTGELSAADAGVLVAEFAALWADPDSAYVPVAVTDAVLAAAAGLTARHGLRAYDAVQLASALAARVADPSVRELACFDGQLREAALREGFVAV